MNCRCCDMSAGMIFLWEDRDGEKWYRCLACGSDSSTSRIENIKYDSSFLQAHKDGLPPEGGEHAAMPNILWFVDHRNSLPNSSFLDVGFADGSILAGMQSRGFSIHGFEVNEASYLGTHTTIRPFFSASHFPQRYAAVLCREVIEHVDDWRQMLVELHRVTEDGGICQIQTPRPWHEFHAMPYYKQHLQLMSPYVLRAEAERVGFGVIDFRFWDFGQAWMLRR